MRAKQNFWQKLFGIPGKKLTPMFPVVQSMRLKDAEYFDTEVGHLSILAGIDKWREKYPDDFPDGK